MNALMFFWEVNVFYVSLGRNVLLSSLLLRVLWLMSVRHFKRISALHLLLQSCSCFSKNRGGQTDSGVPPQLLQFITTVVMKADISGNLHISQWLQTLWFVPKEQEPPSTAGLPIWVIKAVSCGSWVPLCFKQNCGSSIKWLRPPENVEGVSSARRVLVILKIHWSSSLNICCDHSLGILTVSVNFKSFLILQKLLA